LKTEPEREKKYLRVKRQTCHIRYSFEQFTAHKKYQFCKKPFLSFLFFVQQKLLSNFFRLLRRKTLPILTQEKQLIKLGLKPLQFIMHLVLKNFEKMKDNLIACTTYNVRTYF